MLIKEVGLKYRNTRHRYSKDVLTSPEDVVEYMKGAFDERPEQEQFWVILLNRKNRPLGRFLCTLGTVSSVTVHPREVFRPAVMQAASSVVVVHNHPSGDPCPSSHDERITQQLLKASLAIDIELLDHIIIGSEDVDPLGIGYYSFLNN